MRGFQTKPIYLFGGLGMLLGTIAMALAALVLWEKFARGVWVHRNPLFILSMIFSVMAVQFLMLGLLAEILVRTYFESQDKPAYLIGERVGFSAAKPVNEVHEPASPSPAPAVLARPVVTVSTSALEGAARRLRAETSIDPVDSIAKS